MNFVSINSISNKNSDEEKNIFKRINNNIKIKLNINGYIIVNVVITVILLTLISMPKLEYFSLPETDEIASREYLFSKNLKFINQEKTDLVVSEKLKDLVPAFNIDTTREFDKLYFQNLIDVYDLNVLSELYNNIINKGFYPFEKPFDEVYYIEVTYVRKINDRKLRNVVNYDYEDIKIIFGENRLKNFINDYFESKNIELKEEELNVFIGFFNKYPNVRFNQVRYNQQFNLLKNAVTPVYDTYSKNDVIVAKGDTITENHITLLKTIRQVHWQVKIRSIISNFIFFFLLIFVFYDFIYYEFFDIFKKVKFFVILSILILFPALLLKLFIIGLSHSHYITGIYNIIFIIPFGVFPIITANLINEKVSYFYNVIIILILTYMYSFTLPSFIEIYAYFNFLFLLTFFISNFAGLLYNLKVKGNTGTIKTGAMIGFVGCCIIFSFYIFAPYLPEHYPKIQVISYICMVLNGVFLAPIFIMGLIPFFENIFTITSNEKLTTISNLNIPFFKEMIIKTPGTYSHSVSVGNLAESAAETIGENPLLARAGAYYHDIGKLSRPSYFIENKEEYEKSKHEKIKPTLSSSIIKSHIKFGVETAKKLKLPEEIIDIIQEHHGTSVIKLFFKQALEEAEPNDVILEEEFRYPGPKPQTKVSAIISIADTLEATVRSMKNMTPTRIEEAVHNTVLMKVNEGQLDECPITLKELTLIQKAFLRILLPGVHKRPEYPDDSKMTNLKKELESKKKKDKDLQKDN